MNTKKGYILLELVLCSFIFIILLLQVFQLASIFVNKFNGLKNNIAKKQAAIFAQDLIAKDLKSTKSLIVFDDNNYILNCNNLDIGWQLKDGTLSRRSGKFNFSTNQWQEPSYSVVCKNVKQLKLSLEKNLFKCVLLTDDGSISFPISKRL